MSKSNDQLAEELKGMLGQTGLRVAIPGDAADDAPDQDDHDASSAEDDPLQADFFKAMNAYRAARTSGDPQSMADAEELLRQTVRSEFHATCPTEG